jgi:hypothetical protein
LIRVQKGKFRRREADFISEDVVQEAKETSKGLVQAIHGLMQGTSAMSKYQYLAHPSGMAIEIAQAKNIPDDEIFKLSQR